VKEPSKIGSKDVNISVHWPDVQFQHAELIHVAWLADNIVKFFFFSVLLISILAKAHTFVVRLSIPPDYCVLIANSMGGGGLVRTLVDWAWHRKSRINYVALWALSAWKVVVSRLDEQQSGKDLEFELFLNQKSLTYSFMYVFHREPDQ
jgi:hypothetical protein